MLSLYPQTFNFSVAESLTLSQHSQQKSSWVSLTLEKSCDALYLELGQMSPYHRKRRSSAWISWAESQGNVDLKWKVGDVARRGTGSPETITTLLISHTLVQHNKFNKEKKKEEGLDRCSGTHTISPFKPWSEVDKDSLLDQTSVRLLWTFFSTKPWPWASAFTFSLPYFIKNPIYLDWFRWKPLIPITWSPLMYDQVPHFSPQPPGDVWSPWPVFGKESVKLV